MKTLSLEMFKAFNPEQPAVGYRALGKGTDYSMGPSQSHLLSPSAVTDWEFNLAKPGLTMAEG